MRASLFVLAAALYAMPVNAQHPAWSNARTMQVDLSNFAYTPRTITLHHGTPYRLHLVNTSGHAHNFVAKDFFAETSLSPASRSAVQDGDVELGGHESADVVLVARHAGTYEVHCSHFMHTTLGMKGTIVVD